MQLKYSVLQYRRRRRRRCLRRAMGRNVLIRLQLLAGRQMLHFVSERFIIVSFIIICSISISSRRLASFLDLVVIVNISFSITFIIIIILLLLTGFIVIRVTCSDKENTCNWLRSRQSFSQFFLRFQFKKNVHLYLKVCAVVNARLTCTLDQLHDATCILRAFTLAKSVCGQSSAPDPAGRTNIAPQTRCLFETSPRTHPRSRPLSSNLSRKKSTLVPFERIIIINSSYLFSENTITTKSILYIRKAAREA